MFLFWLKFIVIIKIKLLKKIYKIITRMEFIVDNAVLKVFLIWYTYIIISSGLYEKKKLI